ncbi:MAG: hypothetical protein Q9166_006883 [cf. Caloplaca sp. 2 TL-2023]
MADLQADNWSSNDVFQAALALQQIAATYRTEPAFAALPKLLKPLQHASYPRAVRLNYGGQLSESTPSSSTLTIPPSTQLSTTSTVVLKSEIITSVCLLPKFPFLQKANTIYPENVQHTGPSTHHRPLRHTLEPYLSRTTVASLEPLIKRNIEALCFHLCSAKADKKPVTLSHLYRCMTADIITAYTLRKSYNLLGEGNEKKSESFLRAFQFTFRLLWLLREIPWLGVVVRVLGKLVGKWMTGDGIIPTLLKWQWEIDTLLQHLHYDRLNSNDLDAGPSSPSIISSYLRKPTLPSDLRIGQPLHDTTIMLLAAGFETTGFTLTTATYHLLSSQNSHILQTLLAELYTAISDPSIMPPWQELEKLPYLTAIIKESLRLSLGASARLPRINHHTQLQYAGWTIPQGTVVGMTHSDLHYDESVFPEPKAFRPERWLEGTEEEMRERESYLVPFSRGSRRCMGIHLAHAELYLTIATIFRRFGAQMQLSGTKRADIEPGRDFFVPAAEPGGNGLRMVIE